MRILCNCDQPTAFRQAAQCGGAVNGITGLLSFLHVLPIPARAVEGWLDLLHRRPVTGGEVFDSQIIGAMLANDVRCIYTFNTSDFKPFAEIETLTP